MHRTVWDTSPEIPPVGHPDVEPAAPSCLGAKRARRAGLRRPVGGKTRRPVRSGRRPRLGRVTRERAGPPAHTAGEAADGDGRGAAAPGLGRGAGETALERPPELPGPRRWRVSGDNF